MNNEVYIQSCENEFLLKEFLQFAVTEFGTIKVNEIINKVNSSGKVSKFLFEAKRINLRLGTEDFLGCIHASSSFIFSKAESISIAAIILLKKWDYEIGKPNAISDNVFLNKRFFSILDKCDCFKSHIKSSPDFFMRFYNHLEMILTRSVLRNNTPVVKTEISFDIILRGAIKRGQKTEFRVIENLEGINFKPHEWIFEGYIKEKGPKFYSAYLGESIVVEYPYQPGSIIKVLDSSSSANNYSQIKIISYYIQRFKDVNQTDAIREGFNAYKDKIEKIYLIDPLADAELFLFQEDWIEKYGSGTFAANVWLWVFEFEPYCLSKGATTLGLSQASIDSLMNASI